MTKIIPSCPNCAYEHTYFNGSFQVCPECTYEWDADNTESDDDVFTVKDSNGNLLTNGCDIILIKDLKLKGCNTILKKGTKAKRIRLVDSDHEIDCKIDGIKIMLRACFVKKA